MLHLCLRVFVSEHAALSGTFTELSLLWVNCIGTYQEYEVEVTCYSFKYMFIFNIWEFQTCTQCVLIKLTTTLPPSNSAHIPPPLFPLITSILFSKPGSLISAACTCMGHAFWARLEQKLVVLRKGLSLHSRLALNMWFSWLGLLTPGLWTYVSMPSS